MVLAKGIAFSLKMRKLCMSSLKNCLLTFYCLKYTGDIFLLFLKLSQTFKNRNNCVDNTNFEGRVTIL